MNKIFVNSLRIFFKIYKIVRTSIISILNPVSLVESSGSLLSIFRVERRVTVAERTTRVNDSLDGN